MASVPASPRHAATRWLSLIVRYAIGIAIVWWLLRTDRVNLGVLRAVDATTALVTLALCSVQLVLSAWRVKVLLAAHGIAVALGRCIAYNAVGIFYSTLLPGGMSGDAVRAYYFWRSREAAEASKASLLGSLLTDRLIGTAMLLFVGLVAATWSAEVLRIPVFYVAMGWLAFLTGAGAYLVLCGTHVLWDLPETSRFQRVAVPIRRVLERMDLRHYPAAAVWKAIASSAVIHVCTMAVIFIFSERLGSGLGIGQVMAVAPVGLLVNAIPISPGGLGVGEKSFDVLYALVGGREGANSFLLARLFLFSPALVGALVLLAQFVASHRVVLARDRSDK